MIRQTFAAALAMLLAAGCTTVEKTTYTETARADATKAAAPAPAPREELVSSIEDKFNDERFFNAHWGVLVKSLDSGEVWYERNADKLFIPASNQKIPTAVSALTYLGPDFRYETAVGHTGTIEGDTLNGDLVVFGTGDPTLYERFFDDSKEVFREWAAMLKDRGITRITGDIIGDDDAWTDERTGSGWPFDELTPWYYAEFGPLTFNENYVDIDIVPPDSPDGKAGLEPNVESDYYDLVNNIRVVEEGNNYISMYRPIGKNTIMLSGQVRAGTDAFEETPTITNPTKWYVWVLKETFQEEGIAVEGLPVDCDELAAWEKSPEDLPRLITHESPPLGEIIQMLMKRSQNVFAETMIYTMGWKAEGRGTFSSGRRVIHQQLEEEFGIDPSGYNYSDGSGLSRYNYISPRIIATIYEGMLDHEYKETWWEAQSIAGVDGTMRSRMRDTAAEGNVRGKTGRVYAVRACSGYVTTADGELLAFSFLCNGHQRSSGEVDAIYDDVLVKLAEYSEKEDEQAK